MSLLLEKRHGINHQRDRHATIHLSDDGRCGKNCTGWLSVRVRFTQVPGVPQTGGLGEVRIGQALKEALQTERSNDIVTGAMDQHLYAYNGEGNFLEGFPVKLDSPDADGAEIITSPEKP